MSSVENIPVRYTRPRTVKGHDVWATSEPPKEMVWEVCPYLRLDRLPPENGCQHCPEWEMHGEDKVQRGCYSFAAETCRVVFAMQARETQS